MSDDYRRDLLDDDGLPLPPMLTTDAGQRRVRIRELLAEVYLPEGVEIWLSATHNSGPLAGRCPNDMLAAGQSREVLSVVNGLLGQIAT